MRPWIKTSQPAGDGRPLARVLLQRQAVVFLASLVCSLLIFFFALQLLSTTLWDQLSQSVRQEVEKEADTIARLLVFEFSHLTALESVAGNDADIDELVKRLLWEKVTFNETIRGIELIGRHADADGRRLAYVFFPTAYGDPGTEKGPQKIFKTFTGPEGELIRLILQKQQVDRTLLEIVNQGRKLETEMLLRYFPLFIPLPERGAVFWGVVKVGISIDALRRFLILLEAEKAELRQTLMWIMAGVTLFALAMGLWGFRRLSRRLAAPLAGYTSLAAALESGPGLDLQTLQTYLKEQESQDIYEMQQLQRLCLRLGETLQTLVTRLVAAAGQAAPGRLLGSLIPKLAAPGEDAMNPAAWADLFVPREESWGPVALDQHLQQFHAFLPTILPPGISLQTARQPVPALYGSEAHLILALLFLVDFSMTVMPPTAELSWQEGTSPDGGLIITLEFSGRRLTEAEIGQLLRPLQTGVDAAVPLGPFLVAAIARQHGGSLELAPRPAGGLRLTLQIPGLPPADAAA